MVAGYVGVDLMEDFLQGGLGATGFSPRSWYLGLYVTNVLIDSTNAPVDFIESNDPLYARILLIAANWTYSVVDGVVTANYPLSVFQFQSGVAVYGYWIVDSTDTYYGGAEEFGSGPINIPVFGGPLPILLTLELVYPGF